MHSGTIGDDFAFARELQARNWVVAREAGLITSGGMFAALCQYFDQILESIALRRGAVLRSYPTILSRKLLNRLEYFDSFPGVATPAGPLHAISPAVCYHSYQALEGRSLTQRPYRITAVGPCARREAGRVVSSPERLWCFSMRELVFFGSSEQVAAECQSLERLLHRAFARGGVETVIEEASDPFFGASSRGKRLLQKLKRLKVELRVSLPTGKSMAVASVNNHESFFTERMSISFADGTRARSGCAAIGLERCAYAFLLHNGLDSAGWPIGVRRFLAQRKYNEAG